MRALISDLHANLEALCAVMKDIEKHDVSEILCLGDVVGYGPDPEACVDCIMDKAGVAIMGNHDYALIHDPLGFNPIAAEVIHMTKERMDPKKNVETEESGSGPQYYTCGHEGGTRPCLLLKHPKDSRWQFIEGLPERYQESGRLFIHASPLDPISEYVLPDRFPWAWKPGRLLELFGAVERLAFCGHTHLPCAIADDMTCAYPQECGYRLTFDPSKKYIVNVGSVGQPRDGDNRACYLLYDDVSRSVEWRRVSYDIQTTVQKSNAMCGEGNWCGARLLVGR